MTISLDAARERLAAIDGGSEGGSLDAKGRLVLPPVPSQDDFAGHCRWLTEAFNLDAQHPITRGAHEGLRGANGHVVLQRLEAPPVRFEPASRINTPARLIEDLSWQMLPSDGAVHDFKAPHARQIAHVIRMLCGASRALTDEQETAGIVGTFLGGAVAVEGHSTYGTGAQRYEAARALHRALDDMSGRPLGAPRYLIEEATGELVVRVADLHATARQYVGGSLARGWVDARMENLGWQRVRLDGHALSGREGRQGPHARVDVYRGHLASAPDEAPVTT